MTGVCQESKRVEPASGGCSLTPSRRQALALATVALLAVGLCAGWLWHAHRSLPLASDEEPALLAAEPQARAIVTVNVNLANWAELSLVPGLGKALSQKIVARRQREGPYRSLDELSEISGIGAIKLAALRPYLTVGDVLSAGERRDEERQGHVGLSTGQ